MNIIIKNYVALCKPKVVFVMVFSAWIGMLMASPRLFPYKAFILGSIGIALSAGSAAVINHILERHIDSRMTRTQRRPVATGTIRVKDATVFSIILGLIGLSLLIFINPLSAALTFFTLIGYSFIYTVFLKHASHQNIVIGGLFGAMPPLLGWACVSNSIDPHGLLLVLIIFCWTPPHFWALAIHRVEDYKKTQLPMLPITHGIPFTKLCIVLYTLLMIISALLPFIVRMSGLLYLFFSSLLGIIFLGYTIKLYVSPVYKEKDDAMQTFKFSIIYLMGLFSALLIDQYCLYVLY